MAAARSSKPPPTSGGACARNAATRASTSCLSTLNGGASASTSERPCESTLTTRSPGCRTPAKRRSRAATESGTPIATLHPARSHRRNFIGEQYRLTLPTMGGGGRLDGGWDVARPRTVAAAERFAQAVVAPLVLAYRLRLIRFRTAANGLSLIPGGAGILLRRAWYGATLANCGERLKVLFGAVIHQPDSRIGDDCQIGDLSRVCLVEIGWHFMSSHSVCFVSGCHTLGYERSDIAIRKQPGT